MLNTEQQQSLALFQSYKDFGKLDTKAWGHDTTKSEAYLRKEIREGDTILVEGKTKKGKEILIRQVTAANVYVFAYRRAFFGLGRKHLYQLHEDWQRFKGRPRNEKTKKIRDNYWISEKMHADEIAPEEPLRTKKVRLAHQRALREELHITIDDLNRFIIGNPVGEREERKKSKTFPGLWSEKTLISSAILLRRREVRKRYYDKQEDKVTRFSWVRADKVQGDRERMFTDVISGMEVDSRHGRQF